MTRTNYSELRVERKQATPGTRRQATVTIPNARALKETAKGLCCELGDGCDHWIAKSKIGPHSKVQHDGDRGDLIITEWLAKETGLMWFAHTPTPWARLPHTTRCLKELAVTLPADHPARAIFKRIVDELRKDLGVVQTGGGKGGSSNKDEASAH